VLGNEPNLTEKEEVMPQGAEVTEKAGNSSDSEMSCKNCKEKLVGEFCHHCGEKVYRKSDLSIGHLLREAIAYLIDFDHRLLRTIRFLLGKPGFLTTEYLSGLRLRYLTPLKLFLIANLAYFFFPALMVFVFPSSEGKVGLDYATQLNDHISAEGKWYHRIAEKMVNKKIERKNLVLEAYEKEFDRNLDTNSRTLVLVMVPLFAFILHLLFWKPRYFYVEHLIFSFHFWSFLLLMVVVLGSLAGFLTFGLKVPDDVSMLIIIIGGVVAISIYLFLALKRVYRQSAVLCLLKSILLTVSSQTIVAELYYSILFLITFFTTG
jgi:hypothetical protein